MMRERAIEDKPEILEFIPDQHKTQMMCEKVLEKHTQVIEFVPDQ